MICELFCATGRYDLELYTGYEVGVQGEELRTIEGGGIAPVEISRVEIIGSR